MLAAPGWARTETRTKSFRIVSQPAGGGFGQEMATIAANGVPLAAQQLIEVTDYAGDALGARWLEGMLICVLGPQPHLLLAFVQKVVVIIYTFGKCV